MPNEDSMNKTLLAALNDAERLLVAETEPKNLATLDEDEAVALHDRIRRARNKYTGQYRRGASARVGQAGGRGKARPTNRNAALKAEAFEEALARVSRRVATLSHQSAVELKNERIAAARGEKAAATKATAKKPAKKVATSKRSVTKAPVGDRALRSPRTEKNRAATTAKGARRQAKRDSR
jgi:hypothetical protein